LDLTVIGIIPSGSITVANKKTAGTPHRKVNFLTGQAKGVAEDPKGRKYDRPVCHDRQAVTAGVGSRRIALAVASQSKSFVRAIARAKPKATRREAAGKPDGWGDGVKIEN